MCPFSAARYHTSKIREFTDLEEVATFGFRGEALNSLCSLSDMKVVTKHQSVNVATKLELNCRGKIIERTPCARQTGTTITLSNLFGSLPVRKREFERNIQKEFAKMCQILQSYGLISYGKRIILTNYTAKGGKMTIMSTNGSHSMIDNIVAIFGAKQNSNLLEIRPCIEPNETLTQEVLKSLDMSIDIPADEIDNLGLNRFQFEGYVSSCNHGSGRSTRDRQYFFINGRPCDPKFIAKLINDTYHRFNMNQYPFIVLNVLLERREVDVNLTPDKRQILVNNETILRLALKKSLLNTFGQVSGKMRMDTGSKSTLVIDDKRKEVTEAKEQSNVNDDDNVSESSSVEDESHIYTEKGNASKFASMLSQWKSTGNTDGPCTQPKRKAPTLDEISTRNLKMRKIHEYLSQDVKKSNESYSCKSDSESADENENPNDDSMAQSSPVVKKSEEVYRIDCKVNTPRRTVMAATYRVEPIKPAKGSELLNDEGPSGSIQITDEPKHDADETENNTETNTPDSDPFDLPEFDESKNGPDDSAADNDTEEMPMSQPNKIAKCNTTIADIEKLMALEREMQSKLKQKSDNRMKFKTKIDPSKNQVAEQELKTEISKEDFCRMEILGQFNLGFIIVRLDDDLFIIDQHATDEKYNFETLQKTTRIQHQPMVKSQSLGLTAINEMILIDNMKVFEMNGFRFDIDMEAPVTERVKLIAKPYSRNWEFGKEDIDELLFMLQEGGNSDASCMDTCRPSRVRAMFASRACRSSVMIGMPLSQSDMRRLVDHMGTIEQPWVSQPLSSFQR